MYDTDTGLHTLSTDRDFEKRSQLLEDLGLAEPHEELDNFAADLARDAGVPYAMVNVLTNEQYFVGLHGPSEGDLPEVGRTMGRDHGYCPEVIERKKSLVLPDVFAHPRFAGNPVVDKIGIRTYAGAPLIHAPTGTVLGTVCFVGTTPLPRETGQASLELIKARRDALMSRVYRRAG